MKEATEVKGVASRSRVAKGPVKKVDKKVEKKRYLPLIKFCGIKTVEDLLCAADCKVDYCGLIFYKKSLRYLPIQSAKTMLDTARSARTQDLPKIVGVFVDANSEEIQKTADLLSLDCLQLYKPYDYHASSRISHWSVLQVQNQQQLQDVQNFSQQKIAANLISDEILLRKMEKNFAISTQQLLSASAILLDVYTEKQKGGTGSHFDWSWLKNLKINIPYFIAGGIQLSNVSDLLQYRPYGIDISSGIEEEPGKKDHLRMRELASAIQSYSS